MQRFIVIVSLFAFLSANTAFGQVLRLPILVHHYFEHVKWDNSSFTEFISEHYSKTISHSDDKHHDHQNLPFKVLDGQAAKADLMNSHAIVSIEYSGLDYINPNKTSLQKQHFSSAHLSSIWQPPRHS